jgi:putative ABC transport system substrate-binding protein
MSKKIILALLLAVSAGVVGYFSFVHENKDSETEKIYRIGVLSSFEFFANTLDGFKSGMEELGYVEGKNIVYDVRKSDVYIGNELLIEELVDSKVDLILVFATEASIETKTVAEGTGIPVLFANALIEGNNLIETIQRPGGNITGARFTGPGNAVSRYELMREIAPEAKRYIIPFKKGYPTVDPALQALRPLALKDGITLTEMGFDNPAEAASYFTTLTESPLTFDAVLEIAEPIAIIPEVSSAVTAYAEKHQIPIGGAFILNENKGPIFSFTPNNVTTGHLVAPLADKILRGTPAGTIPVVTPEGELQINYKVIQKLGLGVSDGLLSKAVRIVR